MTGEAHAGDERDSAGRRGRASSRTRMGLVLGSLLALSSVACSSSTGDEPIYVPPPCTAGSDERYVAGCDAGIPSDRCGEGFEADGAMGCAPVLPAEACGPGTMALPGETACRALGDCGAPPWGDVVVDADTQHVDGTFAGVSDGSASAPWTTIAEAIGAATNGATIAVAEGVYVEDVLIEGKAVTLWGRCADLVTLSGSAVPVAAVEIRSGANGSEIHGVSITGAAGGIFLSGSTDVVVDSVRIHDSAGRGIALQTELGTPSISVHNVLIEHATDMGIHALGSAISVEASAIRDTRENNQYSTGYAIALQPNPADATPPTAALQQLVLERNRTAAVLLVGGSASLARSLVRDTQPSDLSSRDGVGLIAQNDGGMGASLDVTTSVFSYNHTRGIAVVASSATIEASHVVDTQPQEWDDRTGEGLAVVDGDGIAADATVTESTFDRNHSSAILVRGSSAAFFAVLVRDTAPRGEDKAFGRGFAFVGQPDDGLFAHATVDDSMVVGGHMYGIYLADGSVDIQATMIEAVQAQLLDGAFGDALGVASLTPDAMVSVANVNGSRFEGNSGAGALLWGATLTFGGNTFECNDVDLKAVENYGGLDNPVTIADDGNNDCGCLEVTRACGVAEAIAN